MNASVKAGSLPVETRLGTTALNVVDLERSEQFYSGLLGLRAEHDPVDNSLRLFAPGTMAGPTVEPLLALHPIVNPVPRPHRSTGLYHVALLVPSRIDLGRVLRRLAGTRYPLQGGADHIVSEAIYLADPDGNGIELYRDRPRDSWKYDANGLVRMSSDPLDWEGLIAESEAAGEGGLAEGTIVGHMHLQVADLSAAEAFWQGVIGFDQMAHLPGALFVSAGGYHHHLGLNTWAGADAPPMPENAPGLRWMTLMLPDNVSRDAVLNRFRAAGATFTETDQGVLAHDPSGNTIRLAATPIV